MNLGLPTRVVGQKDIFVIYENMPYMAKGKFVTMVRKPPAPKRLSPPKKAKTVAKAKAPVSTTFPMRISARPGPGGNVLFTTLIYSQRDSITTLALGVNAMKQFNMNSVFDPDRTGVGQQPTFLDQLSPIYERYVVYAVEYKVIIVNQSSSLDEIVGINFNDDISTTVDEQRLIRNGLTEWKVVDRTGGTSQATFQGTLDLPAARGQSYEVYMGDDINQGLVSGSPTQAYVMNIFASHVDDTSGTGGLVRYEVELRYKVKFFGSSLTVNS